MTSNLTAQTTASVSVLPRPATPVVVNVGASVWTICCSWILALWILSIPIRGQVMGYEWYWLKHPDQFWWVLSGSYLDLLYSMGLGLLFVPLLCVARSRFTRSIVHVAYGFACLLSLLYALSSVQVVEMLGHPLTYSWLYYSGFLQSYDAQQALYAGLTWKVITGAILCIVGLITLAWALRRLADWLLCFPIWRRRARVFTLVALALYFPASLYAMRNYAWPLIQNPVVFLASSMLEGAHNDLFTAETSASNTDYSVLGEGQPAELPAAPSPIRNVVVVVLESVGAQYLPAYGDTRALTPNLDSLRKHSKLYRNIYAHAPATNKSIVSLLCSMYPWPTFRFLTQEYPKAQVVSLSDVLHERGYRTAFISAADVRFGNADVFLANHNFDIIQDYRSTPGAQPEYKSEHEFLDGVSDLTVCQSLTKWIEAEPNKPFFATLWTNQTHFPYFATLTPEQMALSGPEALLERYYAALRETDEAIGQLVRELRRLRLEESTLIVVVGDHGEAFGQHGRFGHGKMFGHAAALYEENMHVPLMLINPQLFGGEEDGTVGGLVDVGPTVLDLMNLQRPQIWQGRSLNRPVSRERVYFVAVWSGVLFGFRQGDHKYLYDPASKSYTVFDLRNDPGELANIADQYAPEELRTAYQNLAAWAQYQEKLVQRITQED